MHLRTTLTGVTVLASLAVAGGVGYRIGQEDGPAGTPPPPRLALANSDLAVASSCDALLESYVDRGVEQVGAWGWGGGVVLQEGDVSMPLSSSAAGGVERSMPTTSRTTSEESGTNVQEAGVDESDVVKVAGSLLLRMRDGALMAYDVSAGTPALLSTTRIPDAHGAGRVGDPSGELVLVDGRAVVLGSTGGSTVVTTVDLSDPTSPSIVDTTTITGRASAVRVHGDVVRIVVRSDLPTLDFSSPDGALGELRAGLRNRALVRATTLADWLPTVDGRPVVDCDDVAVPDDETLALGTTTVVAFDPADPAARTATAVATDSDTSYFSADRFYLAAGAPSWGWSECLTCRRPMSAPRDTTPIFAFALDGTDATYVASGEVRGTIADRWSVDAVGDSLRVAVGPGVGTADANSVVTLREEGSSLVEDGRVDGLGVGEEITSVRWFDDLAIVVTFRQTDPLYAVDLTDPAAPVLLGELKIPGYSDYLHPLGEHRLIGIGQDADAQGVLRGAQAALFDVTDLTAPRQIDVVRYDRDTFAGASADPRQFTWLPDQRTALTVVSRFGAAGTTGWVSVLSLADGAMTNRMVDVGPDVDGVRLVPLASGKVVLVTGDDVSFLAL
ncbi:beta-propeller domain-containing protein [Nocardioides hwasunensis]|uniref:Beta-propeller domain-containing protein n=1 Tax=Nocardioides hwasunensis TaxID=397258 RepID=A0ABR8MNU2_9ACTN|nr:beta-propeller domain-containing protein [Nocardioides hwasunensis]MBD3916966.1 beta-propeller domain-containing protein [Nocardioides hwasunensis]